MLDDRDYMRRRPEPENKAKTGLVCVYGLIAINVMAFLLTGFGGSQAHDTLWLSAWGIENGRVWQPLTAMFMHAGFSHILFNMWGLYIFGGIVAPRLGGRAFLALYMTSGLLGNLIWLATAFLTESGSHSVLCGASGAVMGITAAAAVMAPDIPMLLLFIPFPIKLRTMAVVFLVLEIVLGITDRQPGVAHLVHVVGFVSGYLFLKIFFRKEILWDPLTPAAWRRGHRPPPPPPYGGQASGWTYRRAPDRETGGSPNFSTDSSYGFNGTRVSQRELDYLLDKISRSGINSLTEQELQRLRQAREEMRRS